MNGAVGVRVHMRRFFGPLIAGLLMVGCGQHEPDSASAPASPSAGQVAVAPVAKVSYYAAARFLDQASFGPTAAEIERVRTMGFEAWIDEQLRLPPTLLDGSSMRDYDELAQPRERQFAYWRFLDQWFAGALTAPDQLRQRVSWSLSQFIVVSLVNSQPFGVLEYHNLLQRQGLGRYRDLLHAVSTNGAMGGFLDNVGNRSPKACSGCAVNENYARELMQLFSIGLVELEIDGRPKRGSGGRPIESYTQEDVVDLARALTGWEWDHGPTGEGYVHLGRPMVTRDPQLHDSDAKTVLGETFPSGQTARQDMNRAMDLLARHPNTAPFVSLRLIQHLVTSNPSPAFVARVARVFRDNGRGVSGDTAAVVKAILLDPDARRGDTPGADLPTFGKVREPVLFHTALLRGLGCRKMPRRPETGQPFVPQQLPYLAPSVFGFYAPTDAAPSSNLLAPEQRLLLGIELRDRMTSLAHVETVWAPALDTAGCRLDTFVNAATRSTRDFHALLSLTWFRGALPPGLARDGEAHWALTEGSAPRRRVAFTLQYMLSSPHFGAMP